jgi:hypothetical protein
MKKHFQQTIRNQVFKIENTKLNLAGIDQKSGIRNNNKILVNRLIKKAVKHLAAFFYANTFIFLIF